MRVVAGVQEKAADAVRVTGLRKSFHSAQGAMEALAGVDLSLRSGQFLCVLGPSGCGKSTLLNVLAGLEKPTGGTVEWLLPADGDPLFSVVFQEQGVFPWMSVLQNAAYGLRVRGVSRAEREARALAAVEDVGLGRFARALPRELSGGMRQRVNIARAFANGPKVLLMDEPFASVDEQTKLLLQDDLLRVWERDRRTVLFITHSIDEALRLGDRVVVMSARPGRIKLDLAVTLPRPRDVYALQSDASFLRLRGLIWEALREEVEAFR